MPHISDDDWLAGIKARHPAQKHCRGPRDCDHCWLISKLEKAREEIQTLEQTERDLRDVVGAEALLEKSHE